MQHILLIEDQAPVALVLTRMLESQGFRVTCAINGMEGIGFFHDDPADLVITDLNMPVMDGYVVIRTIQEKAPQTKIVVVAAADRDKIEARLTEMGVAAILAKPITQKQLIDTVHSVLGTNAFVDSTTTTFNLIAQ